MGGGGIVSAVWVITAEIVEVRRRATWSQALSVTWSCSAIAGPLLGGIFSGRKSFLYHTVARNFHPIQIYKERYTSPVSWRWGCKSVFIHIFFEIS